MIGSMMRNVIVAAVLGAAVCLPAAASQAAGGDEKAFAKFSKALKARLPEGWKIESIKYGVFGPFETEGGKGVRVHIYDHNAPAVLGKRDPWTDVHIWIMGRDYKPKTPILDRISVACQTGTWRGRRVIAIGGRISWRDNPRDIFVAFGASGDPLCLTSDAAYKSGKWEYRLTARRKAGKFQGATGRLLRDGKPVVESGKVNETVDTPFGKMYWVGPANWNACPIPAVKPDYKLARKITADLALIADYRKRAAYTKELLKDRKRALPALVAMLERGEASVHKDSSILLWEYASAQLMSFDDPRITSHLTARLAKGGDRCNSHVFVRALAKFKVRAAVPYLIRWLRRDGSWSVKYDMFGEEASYQLSALDRIAGTRFGPPDQIGKNEFYMGLERDQVMPKVEKWWKANEGK